MKSTFCSLFTMSLFILLGLNEKAHAQIVNIQSALNGDISDGPGLSAELRQEKKGGNTETERLSGQGTVTYKRPEDLWLLLLRREYSTESGQSSSDNYFEHLRYRYNITDHWGLEAYIQVDADQFRRSERRDVLGTGPRYQFKVTENFDAAVSLSYMHERETFSPHIGEPGEPDRETTRAASVLYLNWKWPDCCTLSNVTYYQPEIGHVHNNKTLNESSLLLQINKHLSYRVSSNYAYNGRPPFGVKKVDTNFLQALVIKI
ncbi:MAG: DUF481 domain-containing protein [Chitinophagaceae bacterium]|nr:DUF481 domain-containing protein [Oligoflexus sp.]